MRSRHKICSLFLSSLALAAAPGLHAQEPTPPEGVDPRAAEILRQMSDYLDSQDRFSVHVDETFDVLLYSGQKLQLTQSGDILVQRPDRLRARLRGDLRDADYYYDGQNFTLFGSEDNLYATVKVPPTLEGAIDEVQTEYGLDTPLGDLIRQGSYEDLMRDVVSGEYIGTSVIDGVETHHLAFQGRDVDFQIWIDTGPEPLPRKYLVTTKWTTGMPQFTAWLSEWDFSPEEGAEVFTFEPPQGAQQIDFLRVLEETSTAPGGSQGGMR